MGGDGFDTNGDFVMSGGTISMNIGEKPQRVSDVVAIWTYLMAQSLLWPQEH